ncbi:MAG: HEPN domain-containing protein [Candidatus Firestonebacteria bacterium]|nr:HEPN domain-containing protein [Candidatus Firestonebacteria bacterium]
MNDINSEIVRKVNQWISYGDEDLDLARHALILENKCPYRLIAYHAQQCAEKYLKAYLVYKNIDFPYTHNIRRLLEFCAEKANWVETIKDAEELTPFAITTRYPGEEETVTKEEALHAIEVATKVRKIVRRALVDEGFNLMGI